MPTDLISLKTIPIASFLARPEAEDAIYQQKLSSLTPLLLTMVSSPRTGAYIRGLARQFNVQLETAQYISLTVIQICFGDVALSELATTLATRIGILPDQAQAMAKDIEKELFGPVMMELNQYLQAKRATDQQSAADDPNVLDLRGRGPVTGNQ